MDGSSWQTTQILRSRWLFNDDCSDWWEFLSSTSSSDDDNSLSSESFNVAYIGIRWVATGNDVEEVGVVCFKYVASIWEAIRQSESLMWMITTQKI